MQLQIEAADESQTHCACCGNLSRTIWGHVDQIVADTRRHIATYYLHWTPAQPFDTHPANFDIIFGPWGEGTGPEDRFAVALIQFLQDGQPGVMVVDAMDRPAAQSDAVGHGLARDAVIGTELAQTVFAIFDAVMVQDHRIRTATNT